MELQAVILAGGASDNVNDLNTPKPLLTIGKKKLVWYPARWLKNSGFVGKMSFIFTDYLLQLNCFK